MFFFSTNEVVERRFQIYSFYLLLEKNNFFLVRSVIHHHPMIFPKQFVDTIPFNIPVFFFLLKSTVEWCIPFLALSRRQLNQFNLLQEEKDFQIYLLLSGRMCAVLIC